MVQGFKGRFAPGGSIGVVSCPGAGGGE